MSIQPLDAELIILILQGSQEDQPPNNLSFEGDSAPYAGNLKETLSPNGRFMLGKKFCSKIFMHG